MHQRNNLTILEGEIFIQHSKQIGSILITAEALSLLEKLIRIDESHPVCDFFWAGDHHCLAFCHRLDEICHL